MIALRAVVALSVFAATAAHADDTVPATPADTAEPVDTTALAPEPEPAIDEGPYPAEQIAAALQPLPQNDSPEPEHRVSLNGLYPLWENTGYVLDGGGFYCGTSDIQAGIAGRVQIGVKPGHFIYRSPNAHARVLVFRDAKVSVAVQAGLELLLPRASETFMTSNYVSRLDNQSGHVLLLPVAPAVSWRVADWLVLHNTFTVLAVFAEAPLADAATPGDVLTAEFVAARRHALLLHLGETGFWNHDLWLAGASYRYNIAWFEFRAGYVYRLTSSGGQAGPLISFAAWL